MANEIVYSTEGADLRAAETNHALWYLLSNAQDAFAAGAMNMGDAGGSGSTVHQVGQVQYNDAMTAPGEIAAVSNTALATASATITIARQQLRRESSLLMLATGSPNQWNYSAREVAQDAFNAASLRRSSMLGGLHASLSSSVGSSGVDASVDDLYDGIFTLRNAGVVGPYTFLGHPQQFNDLQADLRGETSGFNEPDTNAMLSTVGPGFQGTWRGVRFFTNSQIPTANSGADRDGALFGMGAFGYRQASFGSLPALPGMNMQVIPGESPIAVLWETASATTLVAANYVYFVGVAILENARAVRFVTDA